MLKMIVNIIIIGMYLLSWVLTSDSLSSVSAVDSVAQSWTHLFLVIVFLSLLITFNQGGSEKESQ